MEILPKSTKPDPNRHTTRSKYIYEWPLLYRHSGKNQQSKNGVGCQQIEGERVKTKLYCNICQAPVCADTKRHKNIVCLEKQCSVGTIYIVTRHWWVSLHWCWWSVVSWSGELKQESHLVVFIFHDIDITCITKGYQVVPFIKDIDFWMKRGY